MEGCKTAFIEYDAVYEIPRVGYYQRALTVVTYIYEGGHWLSICPTKVATTRHRSTRAPRSC